MKASLIVAGGTGSRMKSTTPKQFLLLHGYPVLAYSLQAFFHFDPTIRILVVIPERLFDRWAELRHRHAITIPHQVIKGGDTRFHSVKNGLDQLDGEGLVAIHDAARPLISPALIDRLFTSAAREGTAIPVVPVNESVRMVQGSSSLPVDRTPLRLVQTPQVFRIPGIKQAYNQPYRDVYTDDATVYESTGDPVCLIEGDPVNIKVTVPADLQLASHLLDPVT